MAIPESTYPPALPMDPCDEDEYDGAFSISNDLNDDNTDNSIAYYSSSGNESSSGIVKPCYKGVNYVMCDHDFQLPYLKYIGNFTIAVQCSKFVCQCLPNKFYFWAPVFGFSPQKFLLLY